jgi:DNA processing protein
MAIATARGITAIALDDERYPGQLGQIGDPPPLLWIRGDVGVLKESTVAIVGSRAATSYALDMTNRLAMDLASAGVVIVSGLARGVDSAAHRAALAARGQTVGVLGCGVDRIYPAEHRDLARDMERCGAVLSEFPPGVPPLPHHFPMRNRIISGLSLAVVVVEAPEKSGSLITASAAAEQGRDVMVVPGPAGSRNRGGHLLIKDGAKIVETADDILQELNLRRKNGADWPLSTAVPQTLPFTVDELAAQSGEQPSVVLAQLLELELAGQIQRIGGGRFIRVLT